MPQVAPFFVSKKSVAPFFVVTWLPNLSSSDTFKGIFGPDSDEKLVPNIIDKYRSEDSLISWNETLGHRCLSYTIVLSTLKRL